MSTDRPAERIVAAAIHDGATINTLPQPARHHTLIHAMAGRGDTKPIRGIQGFITSEGRFVDRHEGNVIAFGTEGELYSEDL